MTNKEQPRLRRVIETLDTHPNKREILQLARKQLEDLHNTNTIETGTKFEKTSY